MLNRRADRGRRAGNSLVLPQVRMKLLELPHLTVGSPTKVRVAGIAQIEMRDLLKATRRVETRGEFIGERLILHEGIVARSADCLLVETLSVKFPAFQACNLRDNYSLLKKNGFEVIGVSPDTEKSHKKFEAKFNLPFTLIADSNHKILDKYGVWGEKLMFGNHYMGVHRTTFMIDEKGIIRKIFLRPKNKAHAEEIVEFDKKKH